MCSIGKDISIIIKPALSALSMPEKVVKKSTNCQIDSPEPLSSPIEESRQNASKKDQEDTFELEYQNMISSSALVNEISQANISSIGSGSLNVSSSSKFTQQQSLRELAVPVIASKGSISSSSGNNDEISFMVLSKRKGMSSGKSVLKSLNIPSSEPLVISTLENISAKEAERSLINTLILESAQKQSSSDI